MSYISLCELPERIEISDQGKVINDTLPVVWDMQLPPHVDLERLQINVSRMRTMQRVAAFATNYITSYEGDITEVTHNIVGINADGSAVAGKSSTIRAEKSKGGYKDPVPFEEEIHTAPDLEDFLKKMVFDKGLHTLGHTISLNKLNMSELASIAAGNTKKEKTPESVWAKLLDSALRDSIRESGHEHLMERGNPYSKFIGGVMAGGVVLDPIIDVAQSRPVIFPIAYALFQAWPLYVRRQIKGETGHILDKRWSFVPMGFQPDRYLALSGLTRVPGLIRSQK